MRKPQLARLLRLPLTLLFGLFASSLFAESFVANPSFEDSFNDEWPHYGPLDLWEGGSGTNLTDGPFHNTGTLVPDGFQVGFMQGSTSLAQDIFGLEEGKRYVVQFFYDARGCCGGTIDLLVNVDDVEVKRIINVTAQEESYLSGSAAFVAASDSARLSFQTVAAGDATVNLDAVSIVQRDEGQIPVPNASFEASGGELEAEEDFVSIAGWIASGFVEVATGGADQDLLARLSGESSISTTIAGLVIGENYDIEFTYGTDDDAKMNVTVEGAPVVTQDTGDGDPFWTATGTFTATAESVTLDFSQTSEGGTLSLDDIKLSGAAAETFPPLVFSPTEAIIGVDQTVQIDVTMPTERQAKPGAIVVVRSANPAVADLVDADGEGLVTLDFSDLEEGPVRSFEVEGFARGSAIIEFVETAGLELTSGLSIDVSAAFIRNASFEAGPLLDGVGYGAIPGWEGGSGINDESQPFLDNGTVPDLERVAFLQQAKTLSQEVSGLDTAKTYWLQFYYNVRNCCGGTINLAVNYAGAELALIENIEPVGDAEPFHLMNIVFQPTAASGVLEFVTTNDGDATLLLDAASIVQRDANDVLVQNPSFEVSLPVVGVGYINTRPGVVAGWEMEGGHGVNVDGVGPFTDNGRADAGDGVLFLQGAASAAQFITGLEDGETYTLSYLVNRRACCNAEETNAYEVLIDDEPVFDEELDPAGGEEPYFERSVEFTATGTEARIMFRNLPSGDQTLLLDDVRVTGKDGGGEPAPLVAPAVEILAGNTVLLSWPDTITGTIVEGSTDLVIWNEVDDSPVADDGMFISAQVIEPDVRTMYYRLRR